MKPEANLLSEKLYIRIKSGGFILEILHDLNKLPITKLNSLNDNDKTAFWINIYNSFNILSLQNNSINLKKRIERKIHFQTKNIKIAGSQFSLDMIEHGILRRSKIWWGLGLLSNPFASRIEKDLRVTKMDYRIHFALNCGGSSCPPIRNYDNEKLDEQLNQAEYAFFFGSKSKPKSSVIYLNRIVKWYWFDFGGKKGVKNLIEKHQLIDQESYSIRFLPYEW